MTRPATHLLGCLLTIAALAGCGGPATAPPGDAGGDVGPPEDGGPLDAGDVAAPRVIATSPDDGATHVALDTAIALAFSEPMDTTAGAIAASVAGSAIALGAPSWSEDGTTVTVVPGAALPAGATVEVSAAAFRDLAGNALGAPHAFSFATDDAIRPRIVRTTPAEGATGVDPALAAIEIEFDEPMRAASGRARIAGPGAPALDVIAWEGRIARLEVSGLAAGAAYELVLEGFEDLAGNALDARALGDDGALDWTTGPDLAAPVVVASTPREGQLDVDLGLVAQIAIELSEPMDSGAGTFTLEVGSTRTVLAPRWDRGGRRALLDVAGRLAAAAPHRVVLEGLRDLAGNALDGAPYLGDGALDFTTGVDRFEPFVAFTSPEEGATGVAGGVLQVVVVFSEAMDPSRATAPMTGDGRTVTLTGTWSSGDTVLTLDAPTLQAGRRYAIDLTAFSDRGGTPVDADHPYLGDGVADFALGAPTGERCGDALTEDEATTTTPTGHEWVIPAGSVARSDGSAPCDPDGHGPDVLVRVRKTTPAARDGGRALHVVVDAAAGESLDVDVRAGDCRTGASMVAGAQLRCLVERPRWEQWLDVGPGDYFVWVARDGASTFTGATVVVEEVSAIRPGESCEAPLDVGAAVHTAPTAPGEPHRWALPAGYPDALDRGVTHADPRAAVACLPSDASIGHDAVVEFEKTSSTSLVTVRVSAPGVAGRHGAVEIVRGCEPGDPARAELGCLPYSASAIDTELTFGGPAGPISAWLVERRSAPLPAGGWGDAPALTLDFTEFEPGPGDSCATAIPIMQGATNAIDASRPYRAHVPACLASGGVTWVRYTPTTGLGIVRTDAATAGAVVDRANGRVLRCQAADSTADGLPVFGVPGEEICVALASSSSVTSVTVEEIPYSGNRGLESAIDVDVPAGIADPISLAWMAASPTDVFRAGIGRVQRAPAAGGPLAQQSFTGLTGDGGGALVRPEGLFVLSSSSAATSGPRLLRITDPAGAFLPAPVPHDTLPAGHLWPDRAFDALAWDGAQFVAGTGQATISGTSPSCCTPVLFFAFPADGGTPSALGSHETIDDVSGLAADATYLYVAGRIFTGTFDASGLSVYEEAIFRLRRDRLGDPTQEPAVLLRGRDLSNDHAALFVDDTTNAGALYVRLYGSSGSGHGNDVVVIVEPDRDPPRWVGPLWRSAPGASPVTGLAQDEAGVLWLLDTATAPDRWVRLE